jgi:hypothetical protein
MTLEPGMLSLLINWYHPCSSNMYVVYINTDLTKYQNSLICFTFFMNFLNICFEYWVARVEKHGKQVFRTNVFFANMHILQIAGTNVPEEFLIIGRFW